MKWFPKGDFLKLNIGEMNFSKKQRGRKSLCEIGKIPERISRRDCAGKVAEIFDPVGRATPIISGMKIDLSDLTVRKLDSEDPLPNDLRKIWIANFELIQDLRDVVFHRVVIPDNALNLEIETIDTADASNKGLFTPISLCEIKSSPERYVYATS